MKQKLFFDSFLENINYLKFYYLNLQVDYFLIFFWKKKKEETDNEDEINSLK